MAKMAKSQTVGQDLVGTTLETMTRLSEGPGSAARMYVAWMEGLGDLGSEAVQFVADRIAEDVRTQHALLHCKNPAELMQVQREFLQKALDQYVAEGGKLAQIGTEIVRNTLTPGKE